MIDIPKIENEIILISPLDWGMGHTTRCVSLIKFILGNNKIIVAGNHSQLEFFKQEFPDIETVFIEGYNVSLDYQKSTYIQLLKQILKLKKTIKREHDALKKIVSQKNISTIISDNRYGCYHAATRNILLTHQLNLQVPYFKKTINKFLEKQLKHFHEVWVPDSIEENLTGQLSNHSLSLPLKKIGLLNRFEILPDKNEFDFLFIASGPEPSKTKFANEIVGLLLSLNKKIAIVGMEISTDSVLCFKNPTGKELNQLIFKSKAVIARAGYTTIMEMVALKKKCVLVPTPGQYEQLYLADHVKRDFIQFVHEKDFAKVLSKI